MQLNSKNLNNLEEFSGTDDGSEVRSLGAKITSIDGLLVKLM